MVREETGRAAEKAGRTIATGANPDEFALFRRHERRFIARPDLLGASRRFTLQFAPLPQGQPECGTARTTGVSSLVGKLRTCAAFVTPRPSTDARSGTGGIRRPQPPTRRDSRRPRGARALDDRRPQPDVDALGGKAELQIIEQLIYDILSGGDKSTRSNTINPLSETRPSKALLRSRLAKIKLCN
jgi:hypothetical protein